MAQPEVGQTWSFLTPQGFRVRIKIERFGLRNQEMRAFGPTVGGKREAQIRVATLVHGRCGARLELEVDGSVPFKAPTTAGHRLREDTMAASDYVKTKRPKGTVTCDERVREALRLRAEGVSADVVAKKFGISPGTLWTWSSKARAAEQDARNRRAMGAQ